MPISLAAQVGDSLCKLATEAGLLNCDPLRALPENKALLDRPLVAGDIVTIPDLVTKAADSSVDAVGKFVKKGGPQPQIRFVHGSPKIPYKDDVSLDHLEISTYITDKGGAADGDQAFPDEAICEFNQAGHDDEDSFKVEVFDPGDTSAEIDLVIEALRPTYAADKTTVTGHQTFPGSVDDATSERGKRSLKVKAKKIGQTNTMRFRSPYLRLVTDEGDKSGTVDPLPPGTFPPKSAAQPRPKQTILVTDMVDAGDDNVEILDQLVEARFDFKNCKQTGDKKCACRARASIGRDRRRVAVAVNILRKQVGGAPIVTQANARRRVLKWVRRIMAQASISPRLIQVREVDPFENFLSVSNAAQNAGANAGGALATGNGSFGFTISAAGQPVPQVVGPIKAVKGQTALQTAQALAAAVVAPFSAEAFPVPIRSNDLRAAADIIVRGPAGTRVILSKIVADDTTQTLEPIRLNPFPDVIFETDSFNVFLGTVHERAICRNYGTGEDRVDLFVVERMDQNSRGEAMLRGREQAKPGHQGVAGVQLKVFMARRCIDGTDADPIVLPHELGHAVADVFHATAKHQMMNGEVTGNMAVGANKRIRDAETEYAGITHKINFHDRYRSEGAVVLTPF